MRGGTTHVESAHYVVCRFVDDRTVKVEFQMNFKFSKKGSLLCDLVNELTTRLCHCVHDPTVKVEIYKNSMWKVVWNMKSKMKSSMEWNMKSKMKSSMEWNMKSDMQDEE